MSTKEDPRPVDIDPQCIRDGIQEALRMYFQPIKNDDPQLDFYTMYKRETMEYDTEYMQKYNEDLNTTLIFAGLFSAVSSAFVIDVQSKLESDSSERSEVYLRAILLSLNPSAAPGEDPTAPPPWNGPPSEIITTLNLLYASLLVSLLAAFVAMLGKQWLNRYLRHTGGSVVERCGDRQRKFDGIEKWPFRGSIESLPIMLQIALILLASALSRYMWSINASVARVIISLTVLTVVVYIGIVVAGTSSYECPFQTPVSIGLRYLFRDNGTTQKLLAILSPSNTFRAIRKLLAILSPSNVFRATRKFLLILSLPNTTSLIYAALIDARQGLVSAPRRVRGISLTRIISWVHSTATKVGHQTITLLLRINRAFGNTKQRLVQWIRRSGRPAVLLPITVEDPYRRLLVPRSGPGPGLRVRNLESIRKRNADNAYCICWILRYITDPEAIDSAIRLAGTIRWFDGDSDLDPPFDFIVSTFESCFDSAGQLYPGMKDRAYFSARAILQIRTNVRSRVPLLIFKFPIPTFFLSSSQHIDPDLHNVLFMLKYNHHGHDSDLSFPRVGTNTSVHSLWMSNLFVELARVGRNPYLTSYHSYLSAASSSHQAVVANTLLVWYMILGGHVEEETLWAFDKSDSLETILSCLSTRVTQVIADGKLLQHLYYLLEFLAAWKKRPECLTPMAYQWCSVISEVAERSGRREIPIVQPRPPRGDLDQEVRRLKSLVPFGTSLGLQLWLGHRDLNLGEGREDAPRTLMSEFRQVGPGCNLVHPDKVAHLPRRGPPKDLIPLEYAHLLFVTLEVGFRLVVPDPNRQTLRLDHTSHHDWMFETIFSSHDDEAIADALCAWITDCDPASLGPLMRHFAKRVERKTPFSLRLRHASICAIESVCNRPLPDWESEIMVSETSETIVGLLDRLDVDVNDVVGRRGWGSLLVVVVLSPLGPVGFPPHCWRLLDQLVWSGESYPPFESDNGDVMRSLEGIGDWENLEVWLAATWQSYNLVRNCGLREDIGRVTFKLLSRRPSALPRFQDICKTDPEWEDRNNELRRIFDLARTEQSPPQSSNECVSPAILFY